MKQADLNINLKRGMALEYREIEFQGKHGVIVLKVPIKEDTQEEIDELHRVFAEVTLNNLKRQKANEKVNPNVG
ncbi:hypothetical protein SAMN05421503_2430 [Terribacillus aidingensis]|uniref:Uncharacterized protein n=1 Tax=Terribacillus aidingensis TaxID=586416 RepID=A0A285NZ69_9BACI|nr:hypothetical protein [Terribacillus aidingensis]SNZ14508.1 hypothetical protein SAMN05421503_2430 [Terribacillus aidingensis]